MTERANPAVPRRKPSRVWRRLLAAALSLLVAVGAAEVAVRWVGAAREVGPSFTEWDSEDGLKVRRNLRTTRIAPEFTMRFSSNSDGFRGPELPPSIERSILCLGDSFTMGYGVDDGQEFPALLAAKGIPGWTVVNAGIGGVGNGRWLHVLERDRARLKPGIVLLQVCGNDFDDNLSDGLFTLNSAGQLAGHPAPPPSLGRRLQPVIDLVPGLSYSHLIALGRQFAARSPVPVLVAVAPSEPAGPVTTPVGHPGRALLHAIVERTIGAARAMGAMPLAVACDVSESELPALAVLLEKSKVNLLVVPNRAARPDLYFKVDGHWNSQGHAFVAGLVWTELQRDSYPLREVR